MKVNIIGAGLAGSEAAWFLANRDVDVTIYEMRPTVSTKAHKTSRAAELVCSNSLKNKKFDNAAGLLKIEMALLGSIMIEAAKVAEVPAGNALAVDREIFSEYIDNKLRSHPKISFINQEVTDLPDFSDQEPLIIASGPLTSLKLADTIAQITNNPNLAFFDAIAPIFFKDSLDLEILFKQSRYEQGGDDYLNLPLNQEEYLDLITAIQSAEKYSGNEAVEQDSPDKLRPFEGCMPIEDIIERGPDTLRHGPLKPKGLADPRTGRWPYAAIQFRQDDQAGNIWSMVGMQTRLKRHEQEKIFRSLPGMNKAEFARYGSFHRNTFIDSPTCLNSTLELRSHPSLFFAGQITGTEGYLESAVGGCLAGINAYQRLQQQEPLSFPSDTAAGSLFDYISDSSRKDFQPINITYGIMPSYFEIMENFPKMNKKDKRYKCSERAVESMKDFITTNLLSTNDLKILRH